MAANAGAPNAVCQTPTKSTRLIVKMGPTITTLVCPKCGDSYFADEYGALMLADHEVYLHGRNPGNLPELFPQDLVRAFVSAYGYPPCTRVHRAVRAAQRRVVLA